MYYLSTETIKRAYNELTETNLILPNDILYFLLLKACGVNKIEYVSFDLVKENGLKYASRLMSLFAPSEPLPNSGVVINPLDMKKWPSQPINDKLKKWVAQRLQNNVIGGGTQWRSYIDIDAEDTKKIKFKYDYVNIFKKAALDSNTVSLVALSIWSHRFTEFATKMTVSELCEEFVRSFKLNVDEINSFFNRSQNFELEFTDTVYDAGEVRKLIENAPIQEWGNVNNSSLTSTISANWFVDNYQFSAKPIDTQEVSVDLIKKLLGIYDQVILEGPPGTSKSFYAHEIAKDFDKVVHVQFHPQYTYQNFVGGYFVERTDVVYKKGIILKLYSEWLAQKEKSVLLIIDEFNRANVSQVLGEVVQCLDRTQSVEVIEDKGEVIELSLPKNIKIIATLNTTDKTLGTIDYAIKRRFASVYCAPDPKLLLDLCPSSNFISLCDFLTKLNKKLIEVTGSRDLTIGHAIFLNESLRREDNDEEHAGKYVWGFEDFRLLYNYKILPMLEDYCSNNREMLEDVVGKQLAAQLDGINFIDAIYDFMELPHD